MANVRKRISELTPLTSASLDTTLLGIDGGTTYKIELDVIADAVTNRVNTLDRDRLSSLESVTSSFETKGRGILSGSVSYTSLTNIPQGIVSQSTDLSSLNQFTASISTASLVTSINNLNTFTASYFTDSASFKSEIATEKNRIDAILSASNTNSDTFAEVVSLINSVDLTNDNAFATFYTASNSRLTSLENATGSYLTSLNGAISSSSQLTSSYDTRYVISGSITQTTWDNIASKPVGIVSSSLQVLGGSGVVSGSYETTGRGIISSSANLVTTSSFNDFSSSVDTRINSIVTESGSNLTYLLEAYANVTYTLPGGFTEDPCRYSVVSATENVPSNWFNTSTYRFTPQKAGYWEINAAYDVYRNTEASMAIRKNGSIIASAGSFNAVAQDISKIIYLNGSTDYIDIVNTGGAALQRNQYQQRSWFQAKFVGNISGSTDLPAGVISGSSQLTSSYDARYVLSGSITQTTWDNIASKPSGIVSGSSQLTSSYDTRYTLSSSYNTDSSSFNSRFNGLVTTGSNTFSGSQVFSGSMTVTSGQVVASSITANTSSLYLTSGSNLYVQNNGVVEITGSLKVKGTSRFETVGGDEGGEIEFGVPQTNTTLSTSVKADVYQNRLRIFDGNTNGVFIDLSKAPIGVAGELMWKASGFVNAGDYVTLGNLKARIPTSGNRSLQVATVSGTYSVYGSGIYSQAGSIAGITLSSPLSITTTPAYLNASAGFTVAGATDTWIISDTVNFIAWRITIVIGPSFNANLITIERLY